MVEPPITLVEAHATNQAVLESIIPLVSSPAPNPLLSRTKLKPAKKPKVKKANLVASVKAVKDSELKIVDAGDGAMSGEEADVLDLADRLLDQLDEERAVQEPTRKLSKGLSDELDAHTQDKTGTRDSRASMSSVGSGSGGRDMLHGLKEDFKEKLKMGHSEDNGKEEKKPSRQQARKARKTSRFEFLKSSAQAEVEQENDQSIEDEKKAIDEGCEKLGVTVKEINPDGHCLYSAIADQINLLGLSPLAETYSSTRRNAGAYMRSYPDEFLPFLETEEEDGLMSPENYSRYCDHVESTGEWGGQPEIMALSKHYDTPIHILQAGSPLVKVGEEIKSGRGPLLISYHRKMYGLGEHYNSLLPKTAITPLPVVI